jgi:hypothetical protein
MFARKLLSVISFLAMMWSCSGVPLVDSSVHSRDADSFLPNAPSLVCVCGGSLCAIVDCLILRAVQCRVLRGLLL